MKQILQINFRNFSGLFISFSLVSISEYRNARQLMLRVLGNQAAADLQKEVRCFLVIFL